jgi:DNA-binding SARP family transcriptional activator/predicted ATPase
VLVLRLSMLGPPVVLRDGAPVTFDTRKAVALLAVLALEDHPHSRARLASLFWPESDETRARSTLRRTLSVTAAAVGEALDVDRNAVRLKPDAWTCDAVEFAALARATDAEQLERAVTLYRDDFLAGFTLKDAPDFEDWLAATAESLRQQLATALGRLVAHRIDAGDLDTAIALARRWLSLDGLHEPAHQVLIRLYAWSGQRSAALQQYRACVRILDDELGVAPLPETVHLAEAVRADRLEPRKPKSGGSPRPTRRPAPSSSPATELPLVGRDMAVQRIRASVDAAAEHGRVLAVAGPVGVGKTRLLTELAHDVHEAGGQVLSVRCHEREHGLAYGVIVDLLRVAELAGADPVPLGPLDGPGAVARLYAAVGDAIVAGCHRSAADRRPGVVLIDDVHWADAASADLIAFLVRRIRDLPVVVAMAYSDQFVADSPLPPAIASAAADGDGDVVVLEPLDRDGVAAVLSTVGVAADSGRIEELHRETGGLPFLLMAYVDALRASADDTSAGDGAAAHVHTAVLARLASVSETTQQILTAAAVLGGPTDLDLLRATSGRSEIETVDAVDEALRAGLFVETPTPAGAPSYDFTYAAMAHLAGERISAARRRLLHGRAADAMARQSRPAAALLAHHLHEAGRDAEAADWHWRAALEARSLFAHTEALHHALQARALGHPAAETHIAVGELLTTLGRYREALASYEAAAADLESSDTDRSAHAGLATVEHRLADVHHRLGNFAVAEGHAQAALDLLRAQPDVDQALVARVIADQAVLAYRQGDEDRADMLANQAMREADSTPDATATAQALDVLGMLAMRREDLVDAEQLLTTSLERAREGADLGCTIAALNNLALVYGRQHEIERALEVAREALSLGATYGDRHRVAALHANIADLLHADGRTTEALASLKESAALFADLDDALDRRPEIWKLVQW